MERFRSLRRVQIQSPPDNRLPPSVEEEADEESERNMTKLRPSEAATTEDLEPFMGLKVRRKTSFHRDHMGDYLSVPSSSSLLKILSKQGDSSVLFADKILKFTGSGKMKRRILLITDFAIYLIDPETHTLKRRIALAAVEKLCLSKLNDNFFAIIVPTEYDCLMASTRKIEIVTLIIEATKGPFEDGLDVGFSNRFEYNAAADMVKEIEFEEVEGGVKTRISRKHAEPRL